jgi:hypothetical protein
MNAVHTEQDMADQALEDWIARLEWRRNKRAKSLTHSIEKGEKLPAAL